MSRPLARRRPLRADERGRSRPCGISGPVTSRMRARAILRPLARGPGKSYGTQYMGSKSTNRAAAGPEVGTGAAVPPPDEVRQILNSLRQIVRSLRVSSRAAEQRVGLSGAQLFVLQCLARRSPCSVNELAARTATDQSSVSVVVSRLVALGHVRRTTSKTDRRRVDLSLSRSGRALLESAPEAVQDRLIAALDQLPKTELKQLSRLLGKVVLGTGAADQVPSLFFEETLSVVAKGRPRNG